MKIVDIIKFPLDPQEAMERAALSLSSMIEHHPPLKQLKAEIETKFCETHQTNSFTKVSKTPYKRTTTEDYFIFDTGFTFKSGKERIFGYTCRNTQIGTPYPYFGLFFSRESVLRSILISDVHIADILFPDISALNEFLDRLKEMAIIENWNFSSYKSGISQPILKNYLEHSYYQAFYEDKISINKTEQTACINSGLLDPYFNEIYIVCDIVDVENPNILFTRMLTNPRIMKSSDRLFSRYVKNIPQPAAFYKDPTELIFDCDTASQLDGISLADRHIFEDNIERINNSLSPGKPKYDVKTNISSCIQAFEASLRYSLSLSKRNYKLVAPQFWAETGKIQFLMPIYLEGKCEEQKGDKKEVSLPNVALCLEKNENGRYLGTSILSLDMAYQNARLIAKPDSFWLEPQKIESKAGEAGDAGTEEEFYESPLNAGDIVDFTYGSTFISKNNGNIIGFFGTVGEGEKAMLHISSLCNEQVTQEEMQKLLSICERQNIRVKLQKKDTRGWSVSLIDVKPSFFEIINGHTSFKDNGTAREHNDVADSSLTQVEYGSQDSDMHGWDKELQDQGSDSQAQDSDLLDRVITGTITHVKEIDHYLPLTGSYIKAIQQGEIQGDNGVVYRVGKAEALKAEKFYEGLRVSFREKENTNPNAPPGVTYACEIQLLEE
jgi:hypothetical protein